MGRIKIACLFVESVHNTSEWRWAATMVLLCSVTRNKQSRRPQFILLAWRFVYSSMSTVAMCWGPLDNGTCGSMSQQRSQVVRLCMWMLYKKCAKSGGHSKVPCPPDTHEPTGTKCTYGSRAGAWRETRTHKPWPRPTSTPASHSLHILDTYAANLT